MHPTPAGVLHCIPEHPALTRLLHYINISTTTLTSNVLHCIELRHSAGLGFGPFYLCLRVIFRLQGPHVCPGPFCVPRSIKCVQVNFRLQGPCVCPGSFSESSVLMCLQVHCVCPSHFQIPEQLSVRAIVCPGVEIARTVGLSS